MNVNPIRVDRIEHLEDINNKIIAELHKCDFAVADLTYARPSVYFEAGFAQRMVPVVYTCRRDHISGKADDEYGNFRVHFDLQMKNIVPWSSPSDQEFARKLKKRIAHAVTPLVHSKLSQQSQQLMAQKFAALALKEKVRRTFGICVDLVKRSGYDGMEITFAELHEHFRGVGRSLHRMEEGLISRMEVLSPGWLGTKSIKGRQDAMMVHVVVTPTTRFLNELSTNLLDGPFYSVNPTSKSGRLNQLVEHVLICSFQKVPLSRIQRGLSQFRFDRTRNEFIYDGRQAVPTSRIRGFEELLVSEYSPFMVPESAFGLLGHNPGRKAHYYQASGRIVTKEAKFVGHLSIVPRHIHIRIVDGVESEPALEQSLVDWLKQIRRHC